MLKILQARLRQYGNHEIPAELFQIQKDAAAKVQHAMCLENPAVATGL